MYGFFFLQKYIKVFLLRIEVLARQLVDHDVRTGLGHDDPPQNHLFPTYTHLLSKKALNSEPCQP